VDRPSAALLSPLVFAIMLEAGMGSELLELRAIIEVGYCQLASEKATPEDWGKIEMAQIAFEEYARSSDWRVDELAQRDLNFHYAILEATHNPLLIRIGRTVEEIFFASMRTTLLKIYDTMQNVDRSIHIHRNIMQTMRDGNLQTIHQAVNDSLSVVELHLPVEQPDL
jgi:GntR family transcriptional repressor for pyruvate dehydrogenase complex